MSNKDINTYNAKGQRHGYWENYWGNGNLFYKCVFHYGKRIGYEEYYDYYNINGKLNKIYYI